MGLFNWFRKRKREGTPELYKLIADAMTEDEADKKVSEGLEAIGFEPIEPEEFEGYKDFRNGESDE